MGKILKAIIIVAISIYIAILVYFVGKNVSFETRVSNAGKFGLAESGYIEFYILLGLLPLILLIAFLYSRFYKSDEDKLIEILKKNMEEKNNNTDSKEM